MSNQDPDEPERPPAEEEVGYRKPPMRRRFKDSGNPKGRPKGAKNRKTIVRMVANERHIVHEKGKRRRRSMLEFVLLRLRNMALEDKISRASNWSSAGERTIAQFHPRASVGVSLSGESHTRCRQSDMAG